MRGYLGKRYSFAFGCCMYYDNIRGRSTERFLRAHEFLALKELFEEDAALVMLAAPKARSDGVGEGSEIRPYV